jgi:hypothetical protein
VLIEKQRGALQHRSTKLKAEKSHNEAFDEDESRHKHNQDLQDSINDHFQDLKTISLKKTIEPEVNTILYFYIYFTLTFLILYRK